MAGEWGVIVVDIQGDFTECRQGSLAVPGSDEAYVKSVETATRQLKELGVFTVGTQDWHPADHISFATSHPGTKPFETIMIDGAGQVLWPPHCVRETENARILVDNSLFFAVVKKSQDPAVESYSAFQDGKGRKTELDAILRTNGIRKIVLYGIATEYCVRATALDLLAGNYETTVIDGLCRGVSPAMAATAVYEIRSKGVRVVNALGEVMEEIRRDMSRGIGVAS